MTDLGWQGMFGVSALIVALLFLLAGRLDERHWKSLYEKERQIHKATRKRHAEKCATCRDNTARNRAVIENVGCTDWRD